MVAKPHPSLIWKALDMAVETAADQRAYVYFGKEISFRQVDQASDHLAAAFLKRGLGKGDRIAIIALNQPEWIYTYFAAAKIGAIILGLNVRYRETELDYMINQARAKALVSIETLGDRDFVSFFEGFRQRIPTVAHFIFIGAGGFAGSHSMETLLKTPVDARALRKAKAAVRPEDEVMIIYTSGTTGYPKGAALSHKSQLAAAHAQAVHTRAGARDVSLITLPLNHTGGITSGLLAMLLAGGCCVLAPLFIPEDTIREAWEQRPTILCAVPTMHRLLMGTKGFQGLDRSVFRLVIVAGSKAPPELLHTLAESYPRAVLMNQYGLSECSGPVIMSPWGTDLDTLVRSIGKPLGTFEAKVVDLDGGQVAPGETGELCVRGDCVMRQYFRMPEATREVLDAEGWLRTGDMACIVRKGWVVFMGRKKEMYIQGGFSVYPVEVENLLAKHPKVLMVAGIGVPDPLLGEIGRYYVVPQPETLPTEKELKQYCAHYVADYKVPRQIVFRSHLPMTPLGKIIKADLVKEYKRSKG